MKIAPYSFATTPAVRDEAKKTLASGKSLIVEVGDPHNQKAVSDFLSSPAFQKDVAVGVVVGGVVGTAAGVVINQITQAHPAVGVAGEILLGIFGGLLGGAVVQDAAATARQAPIGKVMNPSPTVKIDYDPQARHLIAQLVQ
jgi:uncharacterized membrane protein YeaQ/YmgE (transglycosylase-associated protein family)